MITFIQRHLVKATPFLAILTQFCKNSRSSFWTTIIAPSYREIKRYKLDDDRQETEGLVLPLVLEKWCWTSILGDTSMQWLFYILLLCLPNIQVLHRPKDAYASRVLPLRSRQLPVLDPQPLPSYPQTCKTVPLFLFPHFPWISCLPPLEKTLSHHCSLLLSALIFPSFSFSLLRRSAANFW